MRWVRTFTLRRLQLVQPKRDLVCGRRVAIASYHVDVDSYSYRGGTRRCGQAREGLTGLATMNRRIAEGVLLESSAIKKTATEVLGKEGRNSNKRSLYEILAFASVRDLKTANPNRVWR